MRIPSLFLLSILAAGCSSPPRDADYPVREGLWRGVLELPGAGLPFMLMINRTGSYIINGKEKVELKPLVFNRDTVWISFPVYDSHITALISDTMLEGIWYNESRGPEYQVPFSAVFGQEQRFSVSGGPGFDFGGSWEAWFTQEGDTTKAIGVFDQQGNMLTGTFLTSSGDYRFLEGAAVGQEMMLSCFDGSHAFLFHGIRNDQGIVSGEFWSGIHWYETWFAVKNDSALLEDPFEITYLREGYDRLDFTFPDPDSNMISLADDVYKNKAVIVQIMGTWCPNCMDESEFLASFYKENRQRGIEVIGLAYERTEDFKKAGDNISKLVSHLGIDYKILIAGISDRDKAAETLPMLNHIFAYPTTIFIRRDGSIAKIYTGYPGPATGGYHEEFKKDFFAMVDVMIAD